MADPPSAPPVGPPSDVSAAAPAADDIVLAMYNVFKATHGKVSDVIEKLENALTKTDSDVRVSWAMIVMAMLGHDCHGYVGP
jgi:cytochrome c556